MTREEFEKFKLLLTRLEEAKLITMEKEPNSYSNTYNIKTKFMEKDELEKGIIDMKGAMSINYLLDTIKSTENYEDLRDNIKHSFSYLDFGINKFANKIYKYLKREDEKKINDIELEDFYCIKKEGYTTLSLSGNMKKLNDYLERLNAAKTFINSSEYDDVIDKVKKAADELGTMVENSENIDERVACDNYEKIMDSINDATNTYLKHKAKDGIKKNAYEKASICIELRDLTAMNNSKLMKLTINENKDLMASEDNDNNYNLSSFNYDLATKRLNNIYKGKENEIKSIMDYIEESREYLGYFSTKDDWCGLDAKQHLGKMLIGNTIITELMYSLGKKTEFLNSIFESSNPYKKFNDMKDTLVENAPRLVGHYMDDDLINKNYVGELLVDPVKSFENIRENTSTIFKNAKNFDKTVKEQKEKIYEREDIKVKNKSALKEKINLSDLEKDERRQNATREFKGFVKKAKIWNCLADMAKDKDKKAEYVKNAAKNFHRAMFGKIVNSKNIAERHNSLVKNRELGIVH